MGIENLAKYLMLSRLIWQLVRPFALLVAKNTKNTTLDEGMIKAADSILSSNTVEFENETLESDRKIRGGIENEISKKC